MARAWCTLALLAVFASPSAANFFPQDSAVGRVLRMVTHGGLAGPGGDLALNSILPGGHGGHGGHGGASTAGYPEPPPSSVELCAQQGFLCERHEVPTDDGYLVALVHVVGRSSAPWAPPAGRTPVLIQHGMLMSSDGFLLRKDDGNLPLLLSDAGFDVWIGNYRGNAVSPHVHASLSVNSASFWNYSWHEMGLHDLPAMVDYVLALTGQPDLQYVGHSMGSTGLLVLLSSRPEYNAKIRLASFLAPVAYVSTLRSPLFRSLFAIAPQIKNFLTSTGTWNVLPRSAGMHRFFDALCALPAVGEPICEALLFEIAGRSPHQIFPGYPFMFVAYLPAGTTIRILEHYYEVARTGKFRPLGYGMGDPDPGPEYNMSAVTAPVALFYSQNDNFVHPPDVERLARALPGLYHKYEVPDPGFNHFDFLHARDVRPQLYNEMLAVMLRREDELSARHSQHRFFLFYH